MRNTEEFNGFKGYTKHYCLVHQEKRHCRFFQNYFKLFKYGKMAARSDILEFVMSENMMVFL